MEILLALLAAGAFFMAGLVTGAWKYIRSLAKVIF